MRKPLAFFCCLFIFALSQLSFAQSIKVVAEVFPPATNADGSGRQFDMIKAIYQPLGYQIDISVFPYKRAKKLVESQQADIMVGVLYDDSSAMLYSRLPIDADRLVVIYPKSHNVQWQGLDSLRDKHLSVIAGLTQPVKSSLPDIPYQMNDVNTREQAFKKLLFGRTDFLIDCQCGYLLDEVAKYREHFDTQMLDFLKIYIAFADSKTGRELKSLWEQHFLSFINSSLAHDIYQRWGMLREYNILQSYLRSLPVKP